MNKYVKRGTLGIYMKNEAQILGAYDSKFGDNRKTLRMAADPELQDALFRWMTESRNAQLSASGPLICAQARSM